MLVSEAKETVFSPLCRKPRTQVLSRRGSSGLRGEDIYTFLKGYTRENSHVPCGYIFQRSYFVVKFCQIILIHDFIRFGTLYHTQWRRWSNLNKLFLFWRLLSEHARIQRGYRGPDYPSPWKITNIGFLSKSAFNDGPSSAVSETPFKWRFAGGPMMVSLYWYLDPCPLIS